MCHKLRFDKEKKAQKQCEHLCKRTGESLRAYNTYWCYECAAWHFGHIRKRVTGKVGFVDGRLALV